MQNNNKEAKPTDVLTLNVGGQVNLQVLRRTLCAVPNSMMASKFSGRWDDQIERDGEGNIFIDYPPEIFQPLIALLRARVWGNEPKFALPAPTAKDFGGDDRLFRVFLAMLEYYGLFEVFYPVRIGTLLVDMQGVPENESFPKLYVSSGVQFETTHPTFFYLETTLPGYRVSSYQVEIHESKAYSSSETAPNPDPLSRLRGFQIGWYNPATYAKEGNIGDSLSIGVFRPLQFKQGVLKCNRKETTPFVRRHCNPMGKPHPFTSPAPDDWLALFGGIGRWRLSHVTVEPSSSPHVSDAKNGDNAASPEKKRART